MRNFCAKKNTRTCKRFLLGRNYVWYYKLIISIRWQSSNNDRKDFYWLIKSDDDKYKCNSFLSFFKYYFMNQFIWIITAPVLFDSKYCDIDCYWGNYPIQLLVTEWFIFLISSKTSCNPAVHMQLLFTETFHFKRFALLPDGTFHLQFDSRTAPGQS